MTKKRSVNLAPAHRVNLRPGNEAVSHRIANAAAKRVHHVYCRMTVGREVDPLASAAMYERSFETRP